MKLVRDEQTLSEDLSTPLTPDQRIKQLEAELEESRQQAPGDKTMLGVLAKPRDIP
jgi:hypothetical protein